MTKRPSPASRGRKKAQRKPSPAKQPEAGAETAGGFPVVGIGASAGGLEALQKLFEPMPADTGLAFVVVQHLAPEHPSILSELLGKIAVIPVAEASDGQEVRANHIYVIPPDRDLGILHGKLQLLEPVEPRGHRHPIDFFFRSLALDQGERAICIVLSGTGSEGKLGLRSIKESGGLVIVQDPSTAAYDGMPRNAAATGMADFLLAPEAMPGVLTQASGLTRERGGATLGVQDDSLQKVFVLIRDRTGHDLSFYKQNTIVRRIERRMLVHGTDSLDHYIRFLRDSPDEVTSLFKELLIGVTSFFRDPEAFAALRTEVLPAMLENCPPGEELRVWVPGCSTGEEAYSLAILLKDHMEANDLQYAIQVFGTDIDHEAVAAARIGRFPDTISADVPRELLEKYFSLDEGSYQVKRSVRDLIVFAEQNVAKDAPFSRLDLISCRNLLIYMTPALQKRIFPVFHYALKPDGFLFLGNSETVGDATDLFSTLDRKFKLFRCLSSGSSAPHTFDLTPALPGRGPTPEGTKTDRTEANVTYRKLVERLLLADIAPTCLLVDKQLAVLFIHGRTGKYFEVPAGEATQNIVSMAREGLRSELAFCLRQVLRDGVPLERRGLRVETDGEVQHLRLRISRIRHSPDSPSLAMVLIEDDGAVPTPVGPDGSDPAMAVGNHIQELERELRSTQDHLRSTIEELETSNEELKSTNEELQSSNEELQSSNEEQETSKEELQSVNEELVTVNTELENKLIELRKVGNDISNLLDSTNIGTIFLDQELRITRYTTAVCRIVNLIEADVGRPFADIAANLHYPGLLQDLRTMLEDLEPKEVEARATDGRWYLVRLQPYRTVEGAVEGLVATFVDITERKQLEKLNRLAVVVRDSNDAVTVQSFSGTVLAWNRGAAEMYGISEQQALGAPISRIVPEPLREEISGLLNRVRDGERIVNHRTKRISRDGQEIDVWLTLSLIDGAESQEPLLATTERDITWLTRTAVPPT